jgi:hypothetical protein
MTNPSGPADAYFEAMHTQVTKRLGQQLYDASRAVFTADDFNWHDNTARAVIARHFRQIDEMDGFTDGVTQVICAVYTELGHPHNPATVRDAVSRQLAGN